MLPRMHHRLFERTCCCAPECMTKGHQHCKAEREYGWACARVCILTRHMSLAMACTMLHIIYVT